MARYDFASQRLFVNADLAPGRTVPLEREQMNYLINVLRMETGAKVLIFNGRDGEWLADLVQPTRKTAVLNALEQTRAQTPASRITYAFAPLKSARLDYIVQKAVEMGVGALQPVLTQRTQVNRLKDERLFANAIEAAEQCGVLSIPAIHPEVKFAQWLRDLPASTLLVFCDEDSEVKDPIAALGAHKGAQDITVLIGPEGGFDPREREALLARAGTCRLSLGPRILRADTAAVAALTAVQIALGDWVT